MPKVSVILPFYNRAATLPRCLDSVRAQTFTDWEMVAVDDCSRDDSAAVIERYGDPRIRVLRHERNRGAGPARDTAMANARGEWFALIDSDDEWLPGKLAAQMAALERDGRSRLSCGIAPQTRKGKGRGSRNPRLPAAAPILRSIPTTRSRHGSTVGAAADLRRWPSPPSMW